MNSPSSELCILSDLYLNSTTLVRLQTKLSDEAIVGSIRSDMALQLITHCTVL